jgi:hypothetical protein
MKKYSSSATGSDYYTYEDYEPYEGQKKIKNVSSVHGQRRKIKNWKKAWSEHEDDYDEVDDFYDKKK